MPIATIKNNSETLRKTVRKDYKYFIWVEITVIYTLYYSAHLIYTSVMYSPSIVYHYSGVATLVC